MVIVSRDVGSREIPVFDQTYSRGCLHFHETHVAINLGKIVAVFAYGLTRNPVEDRGKRIQLKLARYTRQKYQ